MGRILIFSTIPGLPQSRSLFTPWGTCWSRVLLQRSSYEKLGVRILQRAWFNFDLAWAVALVVSGFVTALV